jgi:hypothetical protein
MTSFPGTLFGGLFVAAGLLFLLMPAFAPHLQGDNPLAFNILGGALFIVVGVCTIQIERDPESMPLWVGMIGATMGAFIIVMSGPTRTTTASTLRAGWWPPLVPVSCWPRLW